MVMGHGVMVHPSLFIRACRLIPIAPLRFLHHSFVLPPGVTILVLLQQDNTSLPCGMCPLSMVVVGQGTRVKSVMQNLEIDITVLFLSTLAPKQWFEFISINSKGLIKRRKIQRYELSLLANTSYANIMHERGMADQ